MKAIIAICFFGVGVSACADKAEPKAISVEIMNKVISASETLYGDSLTFSDVYQSNDAVCGNVTKDKKEQRFIYVRNRFLLEERSPSGEWESQWFTECDRS
ncbi:hypothetical protein [Hellea balneolensis]|uniref:hypothetical protein n=1 Tax=Hellea balneolensis TaxID=287478 RepID=UPI00040A6C90|nr:hypothetical protein [Hellea balneolensis]